VAGYVPASKADCR